MFLWLSLDCKGVFSSWAATAIWRLLKANAFRAGAGKDAYPTALMRLSFALRQWYKSQAAQHIESKSRIGRITLGMLGEDKAPMLSVKAAEMRHSLPFFVQLLQTHRARLDADGGHGSHLHDAGCCLLNISKVIQEGNRRLSPGESAELLTRTYEFLDLWQAAGGKCLPKHHMMVHLARDAARVGNPRFHWVYQDEAMNLDIVNIAQSTHISDFSARVLSKWSMCDD